VSNLQQSDYKLIPAALFYSSHAGLGAWVRHVSHRKMSHLEVTYYGPSYILVKTPTKDLLLTSGLHRDSYALPMIPNIPENWDAFHSFNLFDASVAKDLPLDQFMVNYVQNSKPRLDLGLRPNGVHSEGAPTIYADSGGYQLLMRRVPYIDAAKVAGWYKDNVDYGMVLDYPVSFEDTSLVHRLAEAQALNTEKMVGVMGGDRLINILHGGFGPEHDQAFLDTVETQAINRMAYGGIYTGTIIQQLYNLLKLSGNLKHPYKQHHILGVTNILQLILLIRTGSLGLLPHITSDSSTFLQEGLKKGYYWPQNYSLEFRYVSFGQRVQTLSTLPYRQSVNAKLPCSCPVCSLLEYADIFALGNKTLIDYFLSYHNLFCSAQYVQQVRDIVSDLSTPQLERFIQRNLGRRIGAQETIKGLRFLDCVAELGLKRAASKFGYYLTHNALYNPSDYTMSVQGSLSGIGLDHPPTDSEQWAVSAKDHAYKYLECVKDDRQDLHLRTKGVVKAGKLRNRVATGKTRKRKPEKRKSAVISAQTPTKS